MPKNENNEFWLDHKDNRNRSHFRRRPSYKEKQRDRLLKDWYGETLAREEMLQHRRPALKLSESIPELLKELGKSRSLELGYIQKKWSEIIGKDVAKQTFPTFIKEGVLTVEVNNPTWMYALQSNGLPKMIKSVNEFTDGSVKNIKLIPGGRNRENNR